VQAFKNHITANELIDRTPLNRVMLPWVIIKYRKEEP
jgi:hypothetical protein